MCVTRVTEVTAQDDIRAGGLIFVLLTQKNAAPIWKLRLVLVFSQFLPPGVPVFTFGSHVPYSTLPALLYI